MTTAPILKKVSANGQIGLSKMYRDTYVQYKEEGDQIILKPLFWDATIEVWLTKSEYEDLNGGETVWSDSKGVALSSINL